MMTNPALAEIAQQLREAVTIRRVLRDRGVALHEKPGGRAAALCPLHQEDTPSFRIFPVKDQTERFRCFGCGQRGDVFDLVQLLDEYPDYVSTLRALAEKHRISWPSKAPADSRQPSVLDLATQYYEKHITDQVLAYLESRGFPKAFVCDWHLGYAPLGAPGDLRAVYERRGLLRQALEIGILDRDRRDTFRGRIVFPNRLGGHTVDLQGRLPPPLGNAERNPAGPQYLNLPRPHAHLFNEPGALHKIVVVCEGIPDTLSVLRAGIPACGIYGAQGWREVYRGKFRRCERVYVALDRDAVGRSIKIAREFGRRGRVIVPPEELGPKGDLNDWLRTIAKSDPEVFKKLLAAAMEENVTPWALLIKRLPTAPRTRLWEIEDEIRQLLADLAPLSPIFRDGHLVPLAEKTGLPLSTLKEACKEIADSTLDDEVAPTAVASPLA
jgi:DNA primase